LNYYQQVSLPPVVIVVCGNKNKLSYFSSLICSLSCAVQNILLSAHVLGLGACWVYVYDNDDKEVEIRVKKILKLPLNIMVLCLVPIGYPDEKILHEN